MCSDEGFVTLNQTLLCTAGPSSFFAILQFSTGLLSTWVFMGTLLADLFLSVVLLLFYLGSLRSSRTSLTLHLPHGRPSDVSSKGRRAAGCTISPQNQFPARTPTAEGQYPLASQVWRSWWTPVRELPGQEVAGRRVGSEWVGWGRHWGVNLAVVWLNVEHGWIQSQVDWEQGSGAGGWWGVVLGQRNRRSRRQECVPGSRGQGDLAVQDLSIEQTASDGQQLPSWEWGGAGDPVLLVRVLRLCGGSYQWHYPPQKCPELLIQTQQDPSDVHCGDVKWALALESEVWAPILAPGLRSLVLWDKWLVSSGLECPICPDVGVIIIGGVSWLLTLCLAPVEHFLCVSLRELESLWEIGPIRIPFYRWGNILEMRFRAIHKVIIKLFV